VPPRLGVALVAWVVADRINPVTGETGVAAASSDTGDMVTVSAAEPSGPLAASVSPSSWSSPPTPPSPLSEPDAAPDESEHLDVSPSSRYRHISVHHDVKRGVVRIEMTEAAVLMFYLSGCAFSICGVLLGCTLWQRNRARHKHEPCHCQWCNGGIKERRSLAKGGFGEAALARRHGRTIVLKKIGCASVNDANQALLEAACLQRLHHPGVVTFEDVFLHRHDNGGCSVMIAMEHCAGGDLIDRMACKREELPLTEEQLLSFFGTLSRTLFYVHSCGVLHRDLKSTNVFVTRNDATVKLGDFGLACTGLSRRRLSGSPRRHSRCGTDLYMSPEVEARKPYGASSDVYSLGCVLLELMLQGMLRERRLAEGRMESIAAALALARRRHSWRTFDTLSALARRMLDENPKTRIDLPKAAAIADKCLHSLRASVGRALAADSLPGSSNSGTALARASAGSSAAGVAEGARAVEARGSAAAPPPVHKRGVSRPAADSADSSTSDDSFTAAGFTAAKKQRPARPPNPPRRRRLRYAE